MQSHAIPPVGRSPAMARRLDAAAKAPASDAASPRSFQFVLRCLALYCARKRRISGVLDFSARRCNTFRLAPRWSFHVKNHRRFDAPEPTPVKPPRAERLERWNTTWISTTVAGSKPTRPFAPPKPNRTPTTGRRPPPAGPPANGYGERSTPRAAPTVVPGPNGPT